MFENLLVTGGAGFIGSEFVRAGVSLGYKIAVIDKITYAGDVYRLQNVLNKITFHRVDICDIKAIEKILKKEKVDAVVHFAAETHVDRSILDSAPFMTTNIMGTRVLLEAVKKFGVKRFINISTDEVYGEAKRGKFREDSPLNPSSPYSVSKSASDMLGRAYYRTYGIPVITVRPSNAYGPYQFPEKLIPLAIYNILKNKEIPVYGKGLNVREWTYVSDLVSGIFSVLENGRVSEIYNIGSGEEKRNIDVVKSILLNMNKGEEFIKFVEDRPGHDFRYALNSEKIRNELKWSPIVSFNQGIIKTIEFYTRHLNWLEALLYRKSG